MDASQTTHAAQATYVQGFAAAEQRLHPYIYLGLSVNHSACSMQRGRYTIPSEYTINRFVRFGVLIACINHLLGATYAG
jgi:hypothetical protein